MTGAISLSGGVPQARRARLSTGELLYWAIAFFAVLALSHAAKLWFAQAPTEARVFNAVKVIAWFCAVQLIRRDDKRDGPASIRQIGIVSAILACALFSPSRSGEIALIPLGLYVLLGAGWSAGQRRAGAVFAAIGCQHLIGSTVPILFGHMILTLDTAAAGVLMQLFVPGTAWSGNVLKPPGEVGVTVYMGCSSFANLSYVGLCFASLHSLDGGRLTARALAVAAGTCLLVIVLNTARLVATAWSLESYVYWHNGTGAQLFGIAMTFLTIVVCSIGSKWASECR